MIWRKLRVIRRPQNALAAVRLHTCHERGQSDCGFMLNRWPMMEFLFEQTNDSGSMVILADAQGMVLHALGGCFKANRAQARKSWRVPCTPGDRAGIAPSWPSTARRCRKP